MNDDSGILEYRPRDLIVRVAASARLPLVQTRFRQDRLFWPVDPPGPEDWTVGRLVDAAPTGPLRYAYGPLRDQIIACSYRLADGRLRRSGSGVAKSVAGMALHRLLVGAGGKLAAVEDVTVRLRPCWPMLGTVTANVSPVEEFEPVLAGVLSSELRPVYLEITYREKEGLRLHLGFGDVPSAVAWQIATSRQLLKNMTVSEGSAGESTYASLRDRLAGSNPWLASVRSADVAPIMQNWLRVAVSEGFQIEVQARAGCGVILVRSGESPRSGDFSELQLGALQQGITAVNPAAPPLRQAYPPDPVESAWMNRVQTAFSRVCEVP